MTVFYNILGPVLSGENTFRPAGLSVSIDNLISDIPTVIRTGIILSLQENNLSLTRKEFIDVKTSANNSGVDYFKLGVAPWHGKVHITPATLDVGNLLSSQVRDIFVWNAQRYEKMTITSIVNNAGAGLTITGITLPATIHEVSDLKFELSISAEGDSSINGTIDFITSLGTLHIEVSGRRVVAWHFIPQEPVRERLEFETGITTVHDGTEYRHAERAAPRTVFMFNHRKRDDGQSSALMQNILFDWQSRVFGVPRWWEQHRLTETLPIGQLIIPVNPDFSYFRVNGLALIMQDEISNFEIVEIESLQAGTSITVKEETLKSYAIGSVVVPAQLAVAQPRVSQRLFTLGADDTQISFKSIDDTPIDAIPYDDTFNGLPIFSDDNILPTGNTYSRQMANPFRRTDFKGLPFTFDKTDRSIMTSKKEFFTEQSREIMWKRRSWMHALKGSQGVFYLSTFRNDFSVSSVISSGSTTIDVVNVGFSSFVKSRSPKAAIEVLTTDGQVFRRTVSSASSVDEQTERVSISSPLGVDIAVTEVAKISVLWLCRIADDKVEFLHEGVGNGLMGFKVRGVRA